MAIFYMYEELKSLKLYLQCNVSYIYLLDRDTVID